MRVYLRELNAVLVVLTVLEHHVYIYILCPRKLIACFNSFDCFGAS